MRRPSALLAFTAVAIASLSGCATYYSVPLRSSTGVPAQSVQQPAPGLSIGELLQMLQARRPQNDIIADVRARGLRVAPAPADLDVLSSAGAGPELLQSLQAAAAYTDPQIANGGVAQATVIHDPYPYYDTTYPWVPFGLGLGFGYFAGSGGYWGYPAYRGYVAPRPFIGGGWSFRGHSYSRGGHGYGGGGRGRR
ncbi:MAG TPA: hypothetical protein PK359_08370 [Burkholderiaceae bacterium]|jgi:hypothetical protein|nr:hypothetical protein [Burkholderiaceae bacterium]